MSSVLGLKVTPKKVTILSLKLLFNKVEIFFVNKIFLFSLELTTLFTIDKSILNLLPVFVHSHHVHQHQINDKFGIRKPIHIEHIVCF